MGKGTEYFYTQLPVFDDFSAVSDLSNYTEIPSDWFVVTADVQNSTGAIKSGLYKAVNIIGVSVITSVRNAAKPLEIPYIFGGDGASLCIPPNLLNKARQALISTKKMAITQFGLQLRVGMIPVNVREKIYRLKKQKSQHTLATRLPEGWLQTLLFIFPLRWPHITLEATQRLGSIMLIGL